MNLAQMKYAVEVAEAASMTRAAERLYMSQPNLSRAIRELEESLGIDIFRRTPQGIYPTAAGEEFLEGARAILADVRRLEQSCRGEGERALRFAVSVPRASYIACAFTEFVRGLDPAVPVELYYKETNSTRAVSNLLNDDYNLAILRFRSSYSDAFRDFFREKGLNSELVCEFRKKLLVSRRSPLTRQKTVALAQLGDLVEIAHADPYVPSIPESQLREEELLPGVARRVFVYERASQLQLLSELPDSFMWVSPLPRELLERYELAELDCLEERPMYRDLLVYRAGYSLTELDGRFIDQLVKFKRNNT